MSAKRKDGVRLLSLMMALMLLLSAGLPQIATAESSSDGKKSLYTSKTSTQSKISKDLLDNFNDENQVTFLLKFTEQVNTTKVAEQAADQAKKLQLSKTKTELRKRSLIVSNLRAKALDTQQNVMAFLKKEKKAGNVESFQSFYIVNAIAVTGTKEVAKKLAEFGEVEKVLPNRTRQLIKGDATGKSKTSLTADQLNANEVEPNVEHINAPQVWEMGIDGSGVVIASIDTGVQWDHPALKEKYRGYNPETPDQSNHEFNWFDPINGEAAPYDDIGHGTHTVGTMVGSESDGSNQIGVAPGAEWIAVKAFSALGGTDVDLLAAGEWILAPKDAEGNPHPEMAPDIVNNSWGGGRGLDEWYRPMVQAWRDAGIFPAFAAGNVTATEPGGPGSVAAPSNYPESFAVGAINNENDLAEFSLQGPSPYDEIKPDVVAPGVGTRSAIPGSSYGGKSGTSMATPVVAGTVALLRQADSSLTVDELESALMNSATPLTDGEFTDSPNNGYGYGVINAFRAVSSVTSGLGTIKGQVFKDGEDTEEPTYEHVIPESASSGIAIPLAITVKDNISVQSVQLEYLTADGSWEIIKAPRVSGDYKNGTYTVEIPGNIVAEPAVTYRWRINDYGQNEVVTENFEVQVLPAIFSEDFESEPVGWESSGTNNAWEWGVPTSGPGEAYSGENVYATDLDDTYRNDSDMVLSTPAIQLPEGSANLHFKQWYELESYDFGAYDFAHIYVSTDQENWETIAEFTGETDGWESYGIDISEYAGQTIYIGFHVSSDGSRMFDGWYIDDVVISSSSNIQSLQLVEQTDEKDLKKKTTANADANSTEANLSALPLTATVSVVETGLSTNTNPADGSYSLLHPAGTYTLQADAYGFYPKTQSIDIAEDTTTETSFTLQPIPEGTVTGQVINEATGEPVAGATLMLMEDAAITPVTTDENGQYSITAFEGQYTLHLSAKDYYSKEVELTIAGNETTEKNINIRPFIGYPGELAYDDGTAENARAWYEAGNGWAVKMSLPEDENSAMVTGGKFRFWNEEFPDPGGTDFKVEIWDSSGSDGAPGNKIAGPIDATALRTGEWTTVDLSKEGIIVHDDFYMVYIQTDPHPNSPALAADESSQHNGRSWQLTGGTWTPSPTEEGNYMIRALVNFEIVSPEITSPTDKTFTSEENLTVNGTSAPNTDITILNNGESVVETQTNENGVFSGDITLNKGENIITATASTDVGTTDPSKPVMVTLDQTNPELTITSPADGWKTNEMAAEITGNIQDEHLEWVKVNGEIANVAEDNTYSLRVLLDNGENVIEVTAQDKAGNQTTKNITVLAKFDGPSIENLSPKEDVYLETGESVKITMDSEPGIDASFTIDKPLVNTNMAAQTNNATVLPMEETEEGHYVGYWTVPSDWYAEGAEVRVIAEDDFGNKTEKVADGELFINVPNEAPIANFETPQNLRANEAFSLNADQSIDPDGTLVKYEWKIGKNQKAKKIEGQTINYSFNKPGNYTVTLTVTDNRGATATVTHDLKVGR
ncbi:S8 family serine peptidase [Virgibacillus kekensis]|uniref:S8 family serine peptidase n=1 Tax=Virgibacillus kekensis TaxID=202261 RepID=A0ABV9DKP6_9BACI